MMKTEVSIAGRGLEELYRFLEDKGIEADVKYRFNHWFLSAEIAAVKLCGDRDEIITILLDYYGGRKGKDVELTINNEVKVSFKGKDIAVIRKELTEIRQELNVY